MRHDELRALVHKYFKKALAIQLDRLGVNGPMTERELAPFQTSQALAEASEEEFWDILHPDGTDAFLRQFCEASGVPQSEATANPAAVMREYKLAFRDMLRALEKHRLSIDAYDYPASSGSEVVEQSSQVETSYTLQEAIDEYIHENRRTGAWRGATFAKKEASLDLLTELLGRDRPLANITKQDAQNTKRVLLELPVNRSKMRQTRDLSLLEATQVQGMRKITTVTIDGYISVYQSFYDWAEKNGHAATNLFTGMRLGKTNSKAGPKRSAFEQNALKAVYKEITEDQLGLVRKDSHKWATLIGMFTGAR